MIRYVAEIETSLWMHARLNPAPFLLQLGYQPCRFMQQLLMENVNALSHRAAMNEHYNVIAKQDVFLSHYNV
eukprot:m.344885 g.344885  ORF g.344885 m.344885 type:complete len:72 (+) comp25369_c0_seq1:2951-3166(+)